MKLRYEKNVRVLTDLMGYCHLIGANDFEIDFSLQESHSVILIRAKVKDATQKQIDELTKMLNIPRQREVEQYYWNVSGEEEIDSALSLAGMMIDHAMVNYADGVLTIRAERADAMGE